MLATLAVPLVLAGLPLQESLDDGPTRLVDQLFPTPETGIRIPGLSEARNQDYSLLRMLEDFSEATGYELMLDDFTQQQALNVRPGLLREVEVPPTHVYPFVEGVLRHHGFMLAVYSSEAPRFLGVASLQNGGRVSLKQSVIDVPIEQLEDFGAHPAVLVRTVVSFDHVDVRQLATSLRPLMPDASTQSMLNAGSTNSLILTGFADTILDLSGVMRTIDREQGEHLERQRADGVVDPQQPGAQQGR